jgi:hypothetical protein
MQKKVLMLIILSFFLSGCSWSIKKSGIEIMSYPPAKVFIDGKEAGMTPYKNNSMTPGKAVIKLTTEAGSEWTKTIHLENGANTVISREKEGGYILYFEATGDKNKAGMLINTQPDKAAVAIDDEIKGFSPLRVDNAGDGDKKLVISYPGYRNANSYVKFLNGYQLVVHVDLAKEEAVMTEPESESVTKDSLTTQEVMIMNTETGWLRVRGQASNSSPEIARVQPGEKFKLLQDGEEWRLIELSVGKSGFVSSKYAETL